MLDHHDDKQHVSDTVGEIADGVSDGADKVGEAIADDARQTKDDVEDVLKGEDGNNS
jgi:hypothetical protein